MLAFINLKLLFTLVFLLGLTALSWLMTEYLTISNKSLGALIITFAFIKVRLIILDFMEARHTSFGLRIAFECWIIITAGITFFLNCY